MYLTPGSILGVPSMPNTMISSAFSTSTHWVTETATSAATAPLDRVTEKVTEKVLETATTTLTDTATTTTTKTVLSTSEVFVTKLITTKATATPQLIDRLVTNATATIIDIHTKVDKLGLAPGNLDRIHAAVPWVLSAILAGAAGVAFNYLYDRYRAGQKPPIPVPPGEDAVTWKQNARAVALLLKHAIRKNAQLRKDLEELQSQHDETQQHADALQQAIRRETTRREKTGAKLKATESPTSDDSSSPVTEVIGINADDSILKASPAGAPLPSSSSRSAPTSSIFRPARRLTSRSSSAPPFSTHSSRQRSSILHQTTSSNHRSSGEDKRLSQYSLHYSSSPPNLSLSDSMRLGQTREFQTPERTNQIKTRHERKSRYRISLALEQEMRIRIGQDSPRVRRGDTTVDEEMERIARSVEANRKKKESKPSISSPEVLDNRGYKASSSTPVNKPPSKNSTSATPSTQSTKRKREVVNEDPFETVEARTPSASITTPEAQMMDLRYRAKNAAAGFKLDFSQIPMLKPHWKPSPKRVKLSPPPSPAPAVGCTAIGEQARQETAALPCSDGISRAAPVLGSPPVRFQPTGSTASVAAPNPTASFTAVLTAPTTPPPAKSKRVSLAKSYKKTASKSVPQDEALSPRRSPRKNKAKLSMNERVMSQRSASPEKD